jgi:hypothetical protein
MKSRPAPVRQQEFQPAGSKDPAYDIPMVHGFPSPFVPAATKASKGYGLSYAKKMLAGWQQSETGLISSRARKYHLNRLYSMGMQSENQYKNIISSNKRVKTLNLLYRIQSEIPKYLKTLVEQFMELEEATRCTAIDPFSQEARSTQKSTAERYVKNKDFEEQMQQATGAQTVPDHLKMESMEAVNLYFDLFFKQKKELAFEQALEFIFNENEETELKRQHLINLAVYNKSCQKTTLNEDGTITVHVPNIERLIHSFSRKDNYSDICHAGELLDMTISQLRVLAGSELSEEELFEIYKKAANKPIKLPFDQKWNNSYDREYDSQVIQVFHFEFLTADRIVKEERQTRHGFNLVADQKDTYKLRPEQSDRKLIEKTIQNRYSGYYIPSSQTVFRYGKDKLIERSFNMQKLSKCNLTYDIYEPYNYNGNSKSWVENIMSIADLMQVTFLKIQALVAKAKPAGLAIDIRGLEGVMNGKGGEAFKPLEILSIYEDTGNLLYRSQTADNRPYQGKPVEDMRNQISNQLNDLVGLYNHCIARMQNITGMNPAADGSLNLNQASVGGAKIALNQSNRATRYIYNAWLNLKRRSSQKAANQLQLSVLFGINDAYWENALGKDTLAAIKEGNNPLELSDYGVEIEALPDDNKRQEIMAAVQDAVNKGVITQKDKFIIEELKNYKAAIQYLDYVEKKNKQEAAQQAQQNSQQQAQLAQQTAQAAEQAKQQTEQLVGQNKLQLIQAQGQVTDHLQDKAFYQKMVEIGKLSLEEYNQMFGMNGQVVNAAVAQAASQPPQPDPQQMAQLQQQQMQQQPDPSQQEQGQPSDTPNMVPQG